MWAAVLRGLVLGHQRIGLLSDAVRAVNGTRAQLACTASGEDERLRLVDDVIDTLTRELRTTPG